MKLLILTPQLPYPPHQGTSLRNYHIIRGLAQTHEITLLSYLEETQVLESTSPLHHYCQQVVTVPVVGRTTANRLLQLLTTRLPDMAHRLYSEPFVQALQALLQQNSFDIVQIEGIELARMISIVRQVSPHSKVVFDAHNAETELQRRAFLTDIKTPKRWVAALYSGIQVGRLRRFERWACEAVDGVTAVSETDCQLLQKQLTTDPPPMCVIPNNLDTTQYQRPAPTDELFCFDLIFSGKMDYRPNVDAVLWFAEVVWPRLKQAIPNLTWGIVGQKPHERLSYLAKTDGITLTGWVEETQPYIAGAKVYIMPLRLGSGTRLKLIEAMAAGKAIVSTPVGAEGFPVEDQTHLWLADGVDEWVTAVQQLLEDAQKRKRLGQQAQDFAKQYDWREVVPKFDRLYNLMQ